MRLLKPYTPKICDNEPCSVKLKGKQRRFCSVECGVMYNNRKNSKTPQLKPVDTVKNGSKCKWCIDSKHDEFCCDEHSMLYRQFRNGFDIEMARQKPKPTKAQLKGYAKIEYALINKKIRWI